MAQEGMTEQNSEPTEEPTMAEKIKGWEIRTDSVSVYFKTAERAAKGVQADISHVEEMTGLKGEAAIRQYLQNTAG